MGLAKILSLTKLMAGGSGSGELDIYIEGSPTLVLSNNATRINDDTFNGMSSLVEVHFPKCTSVGDNAFRNCCNLETFGLGDIKSIGVSAFEGCSKLMHGGFAVSCTTIGDYAFADCDISLRLDLYSATNIGKGILKRNRKLQLIHIPLVTSITASAFEECDVLTSVIAPLATNIGDSAFANCIKLTTVDYPLVTSIGVSAFEGCESLTTVDYPLVTSIGDYAFYNCLALTTVDLPLVTNIGDSAFYGCPEVEKIILRSEIFCDMPLSAIIGTKIITSELGLTGEGFIYVPTALYESYVADIVSKGIALAESVGMPMDEPTATYIATAILRKLEDYTVDGTISGELDPTKI